MIASILSSSLLSSELGWRLPWLQVCHARLAAKSSSGSARSLLSHKASSAEVSSTDQSDHKSSMESKTITFNTTCPATTQSVGSQLRTCGFLCYWEVDSGNSTGCWVGGGGGGRRGEEISAGSRYVSQCVTSQSNSHQDWPGAPALQYLISHISVQSRVVAVMWALIMKGPGCHQNKFMNDHMNQTLFFYKLIISQIL